MSRKQQNWYIMLSLCFSPNFHHPILVDIIFSAFNLELLNVLIAQLLDISCLNAIFSFLPQLQCHAPTSFCLSLQIFVRDFISILLEF